MNSHRANRSAHAAFVDQGGGRDHTVEIEQHGPEVTPLDAPARSHVGHRKRAGREALQTWRPFA